MFNLSERELEERIAKVITNLGYSYINNSIYMSDQNNIDRSPIIKVNNKIMQYHEEDIGKGVIKATFDAWEETNWNDIFIMDSTIDDNGWLEKFKQEYQSGRFSDYNNLFTTIAHGLKSIFLSNGQDFINVNTPYVIDGNYSNHNYGIYYYNKIQCDDKAYILTNQDNIILSGMDWIPYAMANEFYNEVD